MSSMYHMKKDFHINHNNSINHSSSCSNIYEPCLVNTSYNQNSILHTYNKNIHKKDKMLFTNNPLINNNYRNGFNLSSSIGMQPHSNVSTKIKRKLIDMNDILFNKRRKIFHNVKRSSSVECNAKDILKYSPFQRSIIDSSLIQKFKDKRMQETFEQQKLKTNKIQLSRKNNEIDHYRYINELKLIANLKQRKL